MAPPSATKQTTLSFSKPSPSPLKRPASPTSPSELEPPLKQSRITDFDVSTSFDPTVQPKVILKHDLDLLFFKGFLKAPGRKDLMEYLLRELEWFRVTYPMRGQTIVTPRWTTVFGCDQTNAHSAAYKIPPKPIPPVLNALKEYVEKRTDATYNFVLVNFYEDGDDSISWHSDDEKFLGPLPTIASLSLGSPRDFQMKHKTLPTTTVPVEKWTLQSGDLVLMKGTTQGCWLHSIPKRKGQGQGGRINITFRKSMSVEGTNNYYRYNVGTGQGIKGDNGPSKALAGISRKK